MAVEALQDSLMRQAYSSSPYPRVQTRHKPKSLADGLAPPLLFLFDFGLHIHTHPRANFLTTFLLFTISYLSVRLPMRNSVPFRAYASQLWHVSWL
jgi:hypothetical protein